MHDIQYITFKIPTTLNFLIFLKLYYIIFLILLKILNVWFDDCKKNDPNVEK